jgi:hypothetical protein
MKIWEYENMIDNYSCAALVVASTSAGHPEEKHTAKPRSGEVPERIVLPDGEVGGELHAAALAPGAPLALVVAAARRLASLVALDRD